MKNGFKNVEILVIFETLLRGQNQNPTGKTIKFYLLKKHMLARCGKKVTMLFGKQVLSAVVIENTLYNNFLPIRDIRLNPFS